MREMSTVYRTFGETTSEVAVWKSEMQLGQQHLHEL